MGEGAAALILESLESALKRGANILGEVVGYGATTDAIHITRPDSVGQAKAMKARMTKAGVNSIDIAYINAHGTATGVGDIAETNSIKSALGVETGQNTAISPTKAIHGHTLGAAGALELVITLQALQNNIAPGTAFLQTADPECDLNYLPLQSIDLDISYAMSNSFAFGGSNASILVSKLQKI